MTEHDVVASMCRLLTRQSRPMQCVGKAVCRLHRSGSHRENSHDDTYPFWLLERCESLCNDFNPSHCREVFDCSIVFDVDRAILICPTCFTEYFVYKSCQFFVTHIYIIQTHTHPCVRTHTNCLFIFILQGEEINSVAYQRPKLGAGYRHVYYSIYCQCK